VNLFQKFLRKIGIIFNLSYVGKYQKKWYDDGGDDKLRYNHDGILDENSLVFDLGGYLGEFSDKINKKYNSNIYIFEIVPKCISKMKVLFKDRKDKISIFPFGLSDKDSEIYFQGNGPGAKLSNSFSKNVARLKSISKFLNENNIKEVDLLKLNIEGSEYSLLSYLCKSELILKFKKIQVQFHDFDSDSFEKILDINRKLSITHSNLYCYPFVWEEWERKN